MYSQSDIEYGAFRLVRGAEVLCVGGMNEDQVTRLAGEIPGAHIEHQDPLTGIWKVW
jgi:hypothetical protein